MPSQMGLSKAVQFYLENGYCVIENILSAVECDRYIQEAEQISEDRNPKYAPIMNPDRIYPAFRDLLCHSSLIQTLESLLHSKLSALQSMYYYKPPGSLGRDLHQDNFYVQTDRGAYIGAWLGLEDADRENGCLVIYPGSHKEPLLEIVEDSDRKKTNNGDFKNDRGIPCRVPKGYQKIYVEVPRGSAVFMHNYTIHGSEENHSQNRFRRSFVAHYIKQGFPFRSGTHAKRQVIDVYSNATH